MAETRTPTPEPAATGAAAAPVERRVRGRRKTDVPSRAETAQKRTRIVQFALFAIAAVITIDALVGEKGLLQNIRAGREYAQMQASIDRLRADNARLREHARRLTDDPAAIEEAARRNLGLVKPGEVLVIVRDADKR